MEGSVRYSEAYKRGIVDCLERGKYRSPREASRKNGIKGKSTVARWIRKYGREDLLPRRVKVETMKEADEVKAMRARVRQLEAALADAHMDWRLESAFLGIACERLGTTREELKKKTGATLAGARRSAARG